MNITIFRRWTQLAAIALAATLQACGGGGGGSSAPPPPVPAITDINSAATASGPIGSGFIVDGSGFGALTGTGTTAGYSIDFRDSTSNAIVASASYVGTSWTDVYIKAVVPTGLTVGTTYKVTVTTPGGTSGSVNFLVTASVALSPSTIAWAGTSALPAAIQGFPTLVAPISNTVNNVTTTKTFVYAIGGNTAASGTLSGKNANVSTVYSNTLSDGTGGTTAGALANASWTTETNALPVVRGFAAGAIANGFNSKVTSSGVLYVLGGLDGVGMATSTVYFASLGNGGAVGAWNTTTALPAARYAFGAVVFHGRLYVVGGNDSADAPTATVYSAAINADGTLGSWSTTAPSLPAPMAYHQVVTTGGVIYALGGTGSSGVDPISASPSASPLSSVYYSSINPDGTLSNWTSNPNSMIKTVEKHTVVAIGSNVLASGGLYNGAATGSTEESYATQSTTDATLGAFSGATGSKTIAGTAGGYNFFNHSAALYVDAAGNPHVLILGGQSIATAPAVPTMQAGVWYMK